MTVLPIFVRERSSFGYYCCIKNEWVLFTAQLSPTHFRPEAHLSPANAAMHFIRIAWHPIPLWVRSGEKRGANVNGADHAHLNSNKIFTIYIFDFNEINTDEPWASRWGWFIINYMIFYAFILLKRSHFAWPNRGGEESEKDKSSRWTECTMYINICVIRRQLAPAMPSAQCRLAIERTNNGRNTFEIPFNPLASAIQPF